MPKQFFRNPINEIATIKFNFVYGLNDKAVGPFLNSEKDTFVHNRKFYRSILEQIPTASNDFIKDDPRGKKTNYKPMEHLIHYWDFDGWGNYIYTLYMYAGTSEDGIHKAEYDKELARNEISIEFLCTIFESEKSDEYSLFKYDKDTGRILNKNEIELLENYGIIKSITSNSRKDKKYYEIRVTKIHINDTLKQSQELEELKEMLCFFSKVAPLSPIGFSILQRLSGEQTRIPIIVRGQSPFLPLKQENIYRCLLAITNGLYIEYYTGETINKYKEVQKDKKREKQWIETKVTATVKPVDIMFDNHFLYEKNRNVYLCVEDNTGKRLWCPVPDNVLLKLIPSKSKHGKLNKHVKSEHTHPVHVYRYTIALLFNGDTEGYIKSKAVRVWKPVSAEENNLKRINRRIPYYPDKDTWEIFRCTYLISSREKNEFERYMKSFGDFVYDISLALEEGSAEDKQFIDIEFKKDNTKNYWYSLCTPYNSLEFFNAFRKKSSKIQSCSNTISSLTIIELYWLEFIMKKYPRFCLVFLSENCENSVYDKILEGLREEIEKRETEYCSSKTFRNIFWRDKKCRLESYFDTKIKDLGGRNEALKYRRIYQGIKEQKLFCETLNSKYFLEKKIVPYALNFHVDDYLLAARGKKAMSVMAYSMIEKRTIVVLFENFDAADSMPFSCYKFSQADIWYHIIAYYVRTQASVLKKFDLQKRNTADRKQSKHMRLLSIEQLYRIKYEECEKVFERIPGGRELRSDAFEKIYEAVKPGEDTISPNLQELQKNGEELFSEEELFYRINILEVFYQIDRFNKDDMKSLLRTLYEIQKKEEYENAANMVNQLLFCLIMGNSRSVRDVKNSIEGIGGEEFQKYDKFSFDFIKEIADTLENNLPRLNEISYTNSVLKRKQVEFRLRKDAKVNEDTLEFIYEYFRGYNCLAKSDDKGNIIFKVEYERFHFRKIHEILLALNDTVEVIKPDEVAVIIKKRVKNKEKIG